MPLPFKLGRLLELVDQDSRKEVTVWLMKVGDSVSSSMVGTVVPELNAALRTICSKVIMP